MFVFGEEIYNNIPKYISNHDELYIHIRGGDIFSGRQENYVQPPLCFYEHILSKFSFKKVFIISEDKRNPIIDALLNKYTNIYYLENNFTQAVSYIAHAQNLAISTSSFSLGIVRLSKNIKNVFIYNCFSNVSKFDWLIDGNKKYKKKYRSIIMEPTKEYITEMFP